jgi:hypothetical protein
MATAARLDGVDAYMKAVRTAERSATEWLGEHLADDVTLTSGPTELHGKSAVLARLGSIYPFTGTLAALGVAAPVVGADGVISVSGTMPALGAAPSALDVTFHFNEEDLISSIEETVAASVAFAPAEPTKELPLFARGAINGALANGTPITFAYVDHDGIPHLSLRGSVQVFGDTQLAIWLRPTDHSAAALAENPVVALLYRDSKSRTTLTIKGTAAVDDRAEVRERVFNLIPEVEQTHDTKREGKALIIEVEELRGTSPIGQLHMKRG